MIKYVRTDNFDIMEFGCPKTRANFAPAAVITRFSEIRIPNPGKVQLVNAKLWKCLITPDCKGYSQGTPLCLLVSSFHTVAPLESGVLRLHIRHEAHRFYWRTNDTL
jgi:hypothetical protein